MLISGIFDYSEIMSETGEIKPSGTHIAMSNLGHIRLKGRRLERLTQKKRGYKYKICSDRLMFLKSSIYPK